MDSKEALINRLVNVLEGLLSSFDGERRTLTELEIESVEAWIPYLDIIPMAVSGNGPSARKQRSRIGRVRCLFTEVFSFIGPEVFLLCALSRWRLGDLADAYCTDLIKVLNIWWKEHQGTSVQLQHCARPLRDGLLSVTAFVEHQKRMTSSSLGNSSNNRTQTNSRRENTQSGEDGWNSIPTAISASDTNSI